MKKVLQKKHHPRQGAVTNKTPSAEKQQFPSSGLTACGS